MDKKSVLKCYCLNNENENKDNIIFYDQYSKKILKIKSNEIIVCDENDNCIKQFNFIPLPRELILFISIDMTVNFINILFEKKIDQNKLLLINTETENINENINLVSDSFDYLIGMFFIENNKYDLNKKDFIMIHINKIVYYSINKKCETKTILTHNYKNVFIKDFSYNIQYKLLLCVRSDEQFDFVDLSEPKNYDKFYTRKFNFYKSINNSIGTIKDKKIYIKTLFGVYNSMDKYTNPQFFLSIVFNQLYFIYLPYLENKIYITQFHSSPYTFINDTVLNIEESKISTLQFVDNLLIIHDVLGKISYVYDFTNTKLINKGTITDFPYYKFFTVCGNFLEDKRNQNHFLYKIEFDSEKFLDIYYPKIRKGTLNPLDIVQILLYRKNNKKAILKLLYDMIYDNFQSMSLIKVFNNLKIIIKNSRNNKIIDDRKKIAITNEEIENDFFKKFLEKDDLTQNQIYNIILYMAYLKNLWLFQQHKRIKNEITTFDEIILSFVKRLDNIYEILYSFDNSYVYYNSYFIFFFISKNIYFEKFGINLLVKLSAFDEILEYYCQKGNFNEVIYFIEEYHGQIKNMKKILIKYKNLIFKHKKKVKKLIK